MERGIRVPEYLYDARFFCDNILRLCRVLNTVFLKILNESGF